MKGNKKIWAITDPCYLADWDERESTGYDLDIESWVENQTGHKAWVSDTGYGDWSNSISGIVEIVDGHNEFCADSGMVCVCCPTEKMIEHIKSFPNPHCAAYFIADEDINVVMDRSDSEWTVVKVYNKEGNLIIQSLNFDA